MAHIPLINLSQVKQNQLSNLVDTKILTASGEIFSTITGSQIQTGNFDNKYVNNTGDQTISGIKNFASRPLVFNTGVLLTGERLSPSQTGELASSGNLRATGLNLQTQINTLSGITGTFTGVFYPRTGNPSGFSSALITGSSFLNLANFTGVVGGQVKIDGNTVIISGDVRTTGVLSIGASGNINTGSYTGNVRLSGGGHSVVFTGQHPIMHISGNTGAYGNFLTPSSIIGVPSITTTGYFPSGLTSGHVVVSGAGTISVYTGISGVIIISGDKVGVKSLAATGTFNTGYFTGDIMLSGSPTTTIFTGTPINNLIVISGNTGSLLLTSQTSIFASTSDLGTTGLTLQNQLERPTGNICMFDSGIKTAVTVQSFQFPILFNQPPFVFTQLKYLGNTGAGLPIIGISGITTSGFSGVYDRVFNTTGYSLNILAMSGLIQTPQTNLESLTGWWVNHPDRPPNNPSSFDDEFNSTGTLPGGNSGKWFWASQGSATAVITGGHLRIRDITDNGVHALYQPISGSSVTGVPWAITTKVKFNDLTYRTFNKFGLFVSGTGANFITWIIRVGNTDSIVHTLSLSQFTGPAALNSETTPTFLSYDRDLYLRILNTGAGVGLFYQYSRDGYSYITANSGTTNAFINHTISNVGFMTDTVNSSAMFNDYEFFRLQTGILP
jgi:hypothetical protein